MLGQELVLTIGWHHDGQHRLSLIMIGFHIVTKLHKIKIIRDLDLNQIRHLSLEQQVMLQGILQLLPKELKV